MIGTGLPEMHPNPNPVAPDSRNIDIERAQEVIYQFLLDLVKTQPPEDVLQEFQYLFFDYHAHPDNVEALQELSDIIINNNVREFINTIKRCCYILINNWETKRNYDCIQKLVASFLSVDCERKRSSRIANKLKNWLNIFRKSSDYEDLKLFIRKYEKGNSQGIQDWQEDHWSQRYTSYLLVPQYVNTQNSQEQREAAKALSHKLKDRFKFDLAMYTTRSQLATYKNKVLENPTNLGENVLRLVKKVIVKKGQFSYSNLANIFLKQVSDVRYHEFKEALQNYLFFLSDRQEGISGLKLKLSQKMEELYPEYDNEQLDEALLLRTCNRIINYFTTETENEPSEIFIYLMFQGSPLTLVIILLKIMFICPSARTHLETRIAELIKYYIHFSEEDCSWAIDFFEIFKIVFAIYADNDVQYNLIKIKDRQSDESDDTSEEAALDSYCIFSQCRSYFKSVLKDDSTKISQSYSA